ncbi:NAD(P)-binding protein [Solirubrobacter taibaiensis]|nr:NAD(P)-binding protein [Solirubrobacter taibaiensis]
MRIAIVGSGLTGLSAAHHLGEDPRHVITVFETRARFGAESVDHLARLGVVLHRSAQVERLAVLATGVWLWIHGRPEQFDVALVTTSSADARALLVRSGMARRVGSATLAERVYFAEGGRTESALARMAADHPSVRLPLSAPRGRYGWLVRRARCLTAAQVEYLDLSGEDWPLEVPAVYIANQRWVLDDAVAPHLTIRCPRRPASSVAAAASVGELEAGRSLAFVVGADALPARAAGLAALAVNAPIVPIAARSGRHRPRARVVIGEPFYPETSSIDELTDDMHALMRHLEHLAIV